jgi:hypothetical protein
MPTIGISLGRDVPCESFRIPRTHPGDGLTEKDYRHRQFPPMSRRFPKLANFDGARFVAQLLPIAPQPVHLTDACPS